MFKLFDKKTSGGTIKNEIIFDKNVTEKLRKPIIKKIKKRTVQSLFKDNIWVADLADMKLIIKCHNGIQFFMMCY